MLLVAVMRISNAFTDSATKTYVQRFFRPIALSFEITVPLYRPRGGQQIRSYQIGSVACRNMSRLQSVVDISLMWHNALVFCSGHRWLQCDKLKLIRNVTHQTWQKRNSIVYYRKSINRSLWCSLNVGLHLVAYYNSEAPPSIWGPASVSTAKSSQAYSKLQRQSLVQNIHDHTAHWPVCSLIDIHVS